MMRSWWDRFVSGSLILLTLICVFSVIGALVWVCLSYPPYGPLFLILLLFVVVATLLGVLVEDEW